MLNILKIITAVFALIGAGAVAFSAIVRVIEAINQLRQKPGLSTWKACWQVVKNFFSIEKYNQ